MSTGLGEFFDNLEKENKEYEDRKEKLRKEIADKAIQNCIEEAYAENRYRDDLQSRYMFKVNEELFVALDRLESLAVNKFRNVDYYAQDSFDKVWCSVLHEVDRYDDGDKRGFKSIKSVQATKKWLKSFSHLCNCSIPEEYKDK